jgi:DNA topoisomerase IA
MELFFLKKKREREREREETMAHIDPMTFQECHVHIIQTQNPKRYPKSSLLNLIGIAVWPTIMFLMLDFSTNT